MNGDEPMSYVDFNVEQAAMKTLQARVARLQRALQRIASQEDYAEQDMVSRRSWCTNVAREALRG